MPAGSPLSQSNKQSEKPETLIFFSLFMFPRAAGSRSCQVTVCWRSRNTRVVKSENEFDLVESSSRSLNPRSIASGTHTFKSQQALGSLFCLVSLRKCPKKIFLLHYKQTEERSLVSPGMKIMRSRNVILASESSIPSLCRASTAESGGGVSFACRFDTILGHTSAP
jgi:hypothetical protein